MKNYLILTILFLSNAFAGNKSEERIQKEFAQLTSEYLNTFKTAEEFLTEANRMGLLGKVEKNSIEDFFKEKQIPLATKILKSKVRGAKIEWDSQSLTIVGVDIVKTKSGRIVKLKNKAMDVIFKEVFDAEIANAAGKESAMSLFLQQAHAETIWINSKVDYAISSALTAASLNIRHFLSRDVEPAVGAAGAKAKYELLLLLRKSKQEENISCYEGKFVHQKPVGDQRAAEAEVRTRVQQKNNVDVYYARHRKLTADEVDTQTYEELRQKLAGTYVHESILRRVWKTGELPKCDSTTLVSAQKALLGEINLQESNLQRSIKGLKPIENRDSAPQEGSQH